LKLGVGTLPSSQWGWIADRFHRVRSIVRRWRLGQRLSFALVVAALIAAAITYAAFTGSLPFLPTTPSSMLILLNVDLVLLLAVAIVITYRIVVLWVERRRRTAGSGLHVRLVASFSLVAAAPAVVVTTFSVTFMHNGLQGWFSSQVETALNNSLTVAEAYVQEHGRALARDALAIVTDLRRNDDIEYRVVEELSRFLDEHLRWRELVAIAIFDSKGEVSARAGRTEDMAGDRVPDWALARARAGEVAVIVGQDGSRLRALVRFRQDPDEFLYLSRAVDPVVLNRVADVRAAVQRFDVLQTQRAEIELTFAAIFTVLALLLVLSAIWFGLIVAGQLARPLAALVEAAERVRAGDLEVRLQQLGNASEFQSLGRVFNRMTTQLRAQRQELIEANRQLDQRRRFTEAVLSGVAAGVIGLDSFGRIRYPNRKASELLWMDLDEYRDHKLADLLPEFGELITSGRRMPDLTAEGQLQHETALGERTLLVRVTAELGGDAGTVVTFSDITDLLDAQRKAAWSDVARRIAHEIKNPLTPIQLSAERLKRRYLAEIESDPETFTQCVDTIVRQVDSLRRMVDEFSDFARLPPAQKDWCDIAALVEEAVALQQTAEPAITFAVLGTDRAVQAFCDADQISQVLTNILQNATQAITQRLGKDSGGEVVISLSSDGEWITIDVADNGVGLPAQLRDRLADPYVTTKAKGSGLGLAIAQKIVTDHDGWLRLFDRPEGGARISFSIHAEPPMQDLKRGA
jgi:two-component system, NtrC family, nitrogen regulation sensor histidine kinase NtrY